MFRKPVLYAVAAVAVALLLAARPARAAIATADLTVSANVISMCTLPTATLAFGAYDPSAGTPLDAEVAVAVTCTYNSTYTVTMSLGANTDGSLRLMAGPGTELLQYELHSAAARDAASVFPVAGGVSYTATTVGTGYVAAPFTVYGRIPAGQAIAAGAYGDLVTMTINF